MTEITEYIPDFRYGQWHKILCQTGGSYLTNPQTVGDKVRVHYTPGDYEQQRNLYQLVTTSVVEKRKRRSLLDQLKRLF